MKFNTKLPQETIQSHQGGVAVPLSVKAELIKASLTAMVSNTYYEKDTAFVQRIKSLVAQTDLDFVLKLAVFARAYGLRSVNHLLVGLVLCSDKEMKEKRSKVYNTLNQMLMRPDEMAEILGACTHIKGKFYLPMALKDAIKRIFQSDKFDAYQYSKYKNAGDIKLHDLVNLVHSKGEFSRMISEGDYQTIDTIQTVSSNNGQDEGAKKEKIQAMLADGKLGDKALLLNIRNFLDWKVDDSQIITAIKNGKFKGIFPYEFIRTADSIKGYGAKASAIIQALFDRALEGFKSLPLEGKVAVLVDTSGSMKTNMSDKSTLQMVDLAAFYGAMAAKLGGVAYAWSDYAKKVDVMADDGVLRIAHNIRNTDVGCGTYMQQAIDAVKNDYDTAIIFSDMQLADEIRSTGKLKTIYCFDLSPYHTGIAVKGNIVHFCGFDDMMFKLGADLVHTDKLVKEIESIKI